MNKLYEVIISQVSKERVVDQPAVEATETTPAVAEVVHFEDRDNICVSLKKIVAFDVEEAITKVKPELTEGQYIGSVTRLHDIDA